jgi:RimJ/RimL family protein N-acetyltransferase
LAGASTIPVIETERLRLRGHRPEDLADSLALWGDPQVTRFIGGVPSTEEEVWARLLRYAGLWSLLGFGYWRIEEKASQRFVGEAGFADFKRALEPSFGGAPEIGWALLPAAQGKGFAGEAVDAVLAWGDARLGAPRTVCMIQPANLPSIRLAQKRGYQEFARTRYKDRPTILYQR